MKKWIQQIVTLYAANGKFHTFVNAVAIGGGTGISTAFIGGIPLNKAGWLMAGGAILGGVKGAITGWLRTNVAIASVQGTGATPTQTKAVAATAAVSASKP
jgi:hypothetical protein